MNRISLSASVADRARCANQSSKKRGSPEALRPSSGCNTTSVLWARMMAVLLAAMAAWLAVTAVPARQLYLVIAFDVAMATIVRAAVRNPTALQSRQ